MPRSCCLMFIAALMVAYLPSGCVNHPPAAIIFPAPPPNADILTGEDDRVSAEIRAAWKNAQRFIIDEPKRRAAAADPRDLHALLAATDTQLANNLPPGFARYDPAALVEFLHDIRRITGVEPPPVFTTRIMGAYYHPGAGLIAFPEEDKPTPFQWQATPDGEFLQISDNFGNAVTWLPVAVSKETGSRKTCGVRSGDTCFVAQPEFRPYSLSAINVATGRVRWHATVSGFAYRELINMMGPGYHDVEFGQSQEAVYVFFADGPRAYIEGFRKSDGSCLARFAIRPW